MQGFVTSHPEAVPTGKVQRDMEAVKKLSNLTRREFVTTSAAGFALGGLAHAAEINPSTEARSGRERDSAPDRGPFRVIIDTDPAKLLEQLAAWTPITVSKWLDPSDR